MGSGLGTPQVGPGSPFPLTPSTAVPFPTLGPTGFTVPTESAILSGVIADINNAFGGNLNFDNLSTPQGQLASSFAAIIGDSFAVFQWFCNMVDPAYSVGRMQDAIGRIYFIERIAGQPSLQNCVCAGLNGSVIPIGTIVQDQNSNLWVATQEGTVVNGAVTLQFACSVDGPTAQPVSLSIYQGVTGLESVTPTGNVVLGNYVESPAQFEARRSQSTGANSMGALNATYGQLLQVPGVLDVFMTQNNSGSSASVNGTTLTANSMYCCVLGGATTAVAQAIYSTKLPGCAMSGNTTVIVSDPNPNYIAPAPTTGITFQIPTLVPIAVVATIKNSTLVPSTALSEVQSSVISAFAGLDGGTRAKIGSTVYGSRYYNGIMSLGATYQGQTGQAIPAWSQPIISVLVGIDGTQATITGSISGTTLTVTAVSSGTVTVNSLVEGTGAINSQLTGSGIVITSQLSGTTGSTGTYNLSQTTPTLGSQTFNLTQLANDVTVNINQAPTVAANNIYVNLQ